MQEINIAGIFIPTFAVLACIAVVISSILGRLLVHTGFYRKIWHRPLFNLGMYISVLSITVTMYNRFIL